MSFSNYTEGKVLDHVLGTTSWTMPTGVYAQLHTGAPGEDGTSNVSAETTRQAATFNAASGGSATLSNTPTWSTWSAGTETISHVTLWDASTSGNCLDWGALSASKQVQDGDDFELTGYTVSLD